MKHGAGTYLERIVDSVRMRLDATSSTMTEPVDAPPTRSLVSSVRAAVARGELGIIAEVKRRSPSVGEIDLSVDPGRKANLYAHAGATGISVLTETDHFAGSLTDLADARRTTAVYATPILRKDFIIDVRQIVEARAAGADAILLIAALHDAATLNELVAAARELSLDVLLEVHDERDLETALTTDAQLIGINNRDLRSFHVDLAVTERIAPQIPEGRIVVAESGVRTDADAARMRDAGVDAILAGESLMRAEDPGALLRALATAGSVHA